MQPGERVEIGKRTRLEEAARVLDRRAGAEGEPLELLQLGIAERVAGTGEDREHADRQALGPQRQRETGVGARPVLAEPPLRR